MLGTVRQKGREVWKLFGDGQLVQQNWTDQCEIDTGRSAERDQEQYQWVTREL